MSNPPESTNEISREFKGIWIPRHIWLHPELSYFEKVLWAEVDSLDREDSGCTASNEYFCKFFSVKNDRTIRRALATLIKYDLIYVAHFNGRIRTLKVRSDRTKKSGQEGIKSPVSSQGNPVQSIYLDNKVDSNITPISPLKRGKRKKVPPVELKQRASRVFTSDTEHEALVKKYGGEEIVQTVYFEWNRWKERNGIDGGDDYKSCMKWTLETRNAQKTTLNTPQSIIKQNKDIARIVCERFDKEAINVKFEANKDCLEISEIKNKNQMPPHILYYTEYDFDDRLQKHMNYLKEKGVLDIPL